jgi:acetyl-CoA acetyltransferase
MSPLSNKAAIVGLGCTEFSKNSGRSEMQLAVEAIRAALDDCDLTPADVDGLCTYTLDNNSECHVFNAIGGHELNFFSRVSYGGGGACAPLLHAAMAVATGVAKTVVCYRAMNERSGLRFGTPTVFHLPESEMLNFSFHAIHGLQTAAAMFAISIRRYMYLTGAKSDDFGQVSVMARKHAATNPTAFFYQRPISLDDYMQSRMIADPFRLLDCCQESDGAVAVVVTSSGRAKDLKQRPVYIRAGAQGASQGSSGLVGYYRDDYDPWVECDQVARQLYAMSGLKPADIQSAVIYDHFAPGVLPALEAFGFCERGEGKDFVRGGNIGLGGRLPINTHGGQLGEAYIHGMNGLAEAVRQLRGQAVNQVENVENMLVTSGNGLPTSGTILGR